MYPLVALLIAGVALYASGFIVVVLFENEWAPYNVECVFMLLTNAGIALIVISSLWLALRYLLP